MLVSDTRGVLTSLQDRICSANDSSDQIRVALKPANSVEGEVCRAPGETGTETPLPPGSTTAPQQFPYHLEENPVPSPWLARLCVIWLFHSLQPSSPRLPAPDSAPADMASLLSLQQARRAGPRPPSTSHLSGWRFLSPIFAWPIPCLRSHLNLIQVFGQAFLDPLFKGLAPSPTPVTFYHITLFHCLQSSLLSSQNDLFSSLPSCLWVFAYAVYSPWNVPPLRFRWLILNLQISVEVSPPQKGLPQSFSRE